MFRKLLIGLKRVTCRVKETVGPTEEPREGWSSGHALGRLIQGLGIRYWLCSAGRALLRGLLRRSEPGQWSYWRNIGTLSPICRHEPSAIHSPKIWWWRMTGHKLEMHCMEILGLLQCEFPTVQTPWPRDHRTTQNFIVDDHSCPLRRI